jgi:GrpB-like predicted nucleotidyltransferase (UPF0157 family)
MAPLDDPAAPEGFDPAIQIVEHDPRWADLARSELARIRQTLGALAVRVEHVGSTAVPDLAAKPIIDLQLSVNELRPEDAYVTPLANLGYLFVPDPLWPDYHFFALPHGRPRTHHLHVCQAGSNHESRHLVVRDYLRTHHREAQQYEDLKRDVAERHAGDRLAYIAGKDQYLSALELRALEWAGTRALPEDLLQVRLATVADAEAIE